MLSQKEFYKITFINKSHTTALCFFVGIYTFLKMLSIYFYKKFYNIVMCK